MLNSWSIVTYPNPRLSDPTLAIIGLLDYFSIDFSCIWQFYFIWLQANLSNCWLNANISQTRIAFTRHTMISKGSSHKLCDPKFGFSPQRVALMQVFTLYTVMLNSLKMLYDRTNQAGESVKFSMKFWNFRNETTGMVLHCLAIHTFVLYQW